MLLYELNELLKSNSLDLPFHKRKVARSGNNLAWLVKHAHVRNDLSPRLKELLGMSIQQLVK